MNTRHPIRIPVWLASTSLLATLVLAPEIHGAEITVRNTLEDGTGAHAIATATFELFDNSDASFSNDGFGIIGRMTISNALISSYFTAGDMTSIQNAFVPFASPFTLDGTGLSGAFLETRSADTRASQNAFGGSAIYFWVYRGSSIAGASEHLIVQFDATFPTDPETGSALQGSAALWPAEVAAVLVGGFGNYAHDYDAGSGPLPGYSTSAPAPEPASASLLAVGFSLMLGGRLRPRSRD